MEHVAIDLFDCETAVVIAVEWRRCLEESASAVERTGGDERWGGRDQGLRQMEDTLQDFVDCSFSDVPERFDFYDADECSVKSEGAIGYTDGRIRDGCFKTGMLVVCPDRRSVMGSGV